MGLPDAGEIALLEEFVNRYIPLHTVAYRYRWGYPTRARSRCSRSLSTRRCTRGARRTAATSSSRAKTTRCGGYMAVTWPLHDRCMTVTVERIRLGATLAAVLDGRDDRPEQPHRAGRHKGRAVPRQGVHTCDRYMAVTRAAPSLAKVCRQRFPKKVCSCNGHVTVM